MAEKKVPPYRVYLQSYNSCFSRQALLFLFPKQYDRPSVKLIHSCRISNPPGRLAITRIDYPKQLSKLPSVFRCRDHPQIPDGAPRGTPAAAPVPAALAAQHGARRSERATPLEPPQLLPGQCIGSLLSLGVPR